MKPKGINFFEQHVEKIVVGVLGAAALGVITMQFVGRSNTVTINNRELPPEQAYEALRREAENVRARLADTTTPADAPTSVPDVSAQVERLMASGVSPAPFLAAPLSSPLAMTGPGAGLDFDDADAPKFSPLIPPAPMRPAAMVVGGAVDPLIVASHPELAAWVPAEQPHDLRAVTVQASFPAAAMIRALERAPGDPAKQTIPRFYWMNRLEVLDVVLERQESLGGGRFGPVEVVPPMPTAPSLRDELASAGLPAAALQSLVNFARDNRVGIVRPPFYPTIAGEPWRPPRLEREGASGDSASRQQADTLRRRLERLESEIEALQSRLQTRQTGAAADQQRIIEERRDRTIAERDRVLGELRAMGVDRVESVQDDVDRVLSAPVGSLESADSLTMWTHDVTARPGASYRYRLRVGVTNPLFGNSSNVAPEDMELVARPVAMSEPSPWSDTVFIEPTTRLYVVGAARPGLGAGEGAMGSPMATVELYRFHYGHWRRVSARLTPGDAIMGELNLPALPRFLIEVAESGQARVVGREDGPTTLPVALDAFVVDVVESSTVDIAGQTRAQWQVVFRDEEGRLVVRLPDEDRLRSSRRAAETSATIAETAGVGEPGARAAPQQRERQSTPAAPAGRTGGGTSGQRTD
ncbi:MAG: hypothetical protein EA379_11935 [Phycisphaerales bacterium]|nr:MAG: hypothetical protein EA379_11935 [Phycisphaerales bacterium]